MKEVLILGSGFSSLSSACYLAGKGYRVSVFEKNATLGGRARQFRRDGFTFDMGPTFYWMPEIFDRFFADFGKKRSDYYSLTQLDPAYRIYFGTNDAVTIPAGEDCICRVFESVEPGAGQFLKDFLRKASFNYRVAMEKVIFKPGISPFELIMPETISRVGQFTTTISQHVRHHIQDPRLARILEFPVLFLGAKPSRTPLFYCFMNYADMVLGTWHPVGGFYQVVEAMHKLCIELGVTIHIASPVEKIVVKGNQATGIRVNGEYVQGDFVISGADYHHTEQLLEKTYRNYSQHFWDKKTFAPSGMLYYVAFDKKLKNVDHHTLFFDTDFDAHAADIYDTPRWPEKPLFYASFPGITDQTLVPPGKEAGIFLIPLAPGLTDDEEHKETYFKQIIHRMEKITAQELTDHVLFKEVYGPTDFMRDYGAFKGNAYGLANTLRQTAFLKPKMQNKKIRNLLYTGQLTVPGPGVPPTLISGKIAATLADKTIKEKP